MRCSPVIRKLLFLCIRSVVRLLRSVMRRVTILKLRIQGADVDGSANIHWSAIVEVSGGKVSIGPRTMVDRGVLLRTYGGSIRIGADCTVNAYSVLTGGGGLVIGNDVRIGTHVVIYPSNHLFSDPSIPIRLQGESRIGIVIEDDVWVGAGVRILDGVTIGRGGVLAAGAVVTRTTAPFAVSAGVPARKISERAGIASQSS